MNKKEKVCVVSLGCSKNTVDSERLIRQLELNGFILEADAEKAEAVIINTCGFITPAKEESIEAILAAAELKKNGAVKKIIVAGCLSERYMKDLREDIPEVDRYFGVEDYPGILKELGGSFIDGSRLERSLLTEKHMAYLKVSEGCSNGCSFCAIPMIRGRQRSKPVEEIITEAKLLADNGVRELVLIGQDTTSYGLDLYRKRNIAQVLRETAGIGGLEWIRLLYAHPLGFPLDVLDAMSADRKICRYIDIPLQHISDKILGSMKRAIDSEQIKRLLAEIRMTLPDITLRTTFIVGYPNETEAEFRELCEFVKDSRFDRIGAFKYSAEENTLSYSMGDPVPEEEKDARLAELMGIQQSISLENNRSLVGKKLKVIIDRCAEDSGERSYIGRSEKDAPEVDGEVIISSGGTAAEEGEFREVIIDDCDEYDLYGTFC